MKRKTITIVILVFLLQIGTIVSANIAGGALILSGQLWINNDEGGGMPRAETKIETHTDKRQRGYYNGWLHVNFDTGTLRRLEGTFEAWGYWQAENDELSQEYFYYNDSFNFSRKNRPDNIDIKPSRYLQGKGTIYVGVSASYTVYKLADKETPECEDVWIELKTINIESQSEREMIFRNYWLLENHLFMFPMLRALLNRLPFGL